MKKLFAILLVLAGIFTLSATEYLGPSEDNLSKYYVCNTNEEVAILLGYPPEDFNLAEFYNGIFKAAEEWIEPSTYVVRVDIDGGFYVVTTTGEYDLFFTNREGNNGED